MRARRIRAVCKKLRIHQGDLSKEARIDRSTLNGFCNGRLKLSEEQLDRVEAGIRKIASDQLAKVLQVLTPAA
jgi:hypothetical protein